MSVQVVADLTQKLLRRFASKGSIVPMSEDERRQLRELEAQLARNRRLVALARRLESTSVDTGQRRVSVLWIAAGGFIGLVLVVAGAVAHASVLVATGVVVLAATLMVVGAASLVVEARSGTGASSARLGRPEP